MPVQNLVEINYISPSILEASVETRPPKLHHCFTPIHFPPPPPPPSPTIPDIFRPPRRGSAMQVFLVEDSIADSQDTEFLRKAQKCSVTGFLCRGVCPPDDTPLDVICHVVVL